jgi:7-cyano-7-deazaguanine synthase
VIDRIAHRFATPALLDQALTHRSAGAPHNERLEFLGDALVNLIVEHTHTCYLGDRVHRHAWGYGCGSCPACELRAAGHAEWVASR